MPTLLELASSIVSAHASTSAMSREELITELQEVHNALSKMEKGEAVSIESQETPQAEEQPAVSMKKAFGKKQIICMICGKGMKTLGRHLKSAHDMTPKEYRNQFNIPRTQTLAAKDYSESRRQMAIEKDLGAGLAKARAAKGKKKE